VRNTEITYLCCSSQDCIMIELKTRVGKVSQVRGTWEHITATNVQTIQEGCMHTCSQPRQVICRHKDPTMQKWEYILLKPICSLYLTSAKLQNSHTTWSQRWQNFTVPSIEWSRNTQNFKCCMQNSSICLFYRETCP
jgi:hypothetical protein